MPRSPVATRQASQDDIPVLARLWLELEEVGGRAERAVNPFVSPDELEVRLKEVIADGSCRVVLATVDGEPAGMAVLRTYEPDPLSQHRMVQIAHLVVTRAYRRRGVGHALVAAAADYADERQVEHVSTGVFPSLRDAARFYARLGFAPARVQRVAPLSMLRRRLQGCDAPVRRVDELIRRRNRLRRPLPAGELRPPGASLH